MAAGPPLHFICFAIIFSAVTSIIQGAVNNSVIVAEQVLRGASGVTNLVVDARVPSEDRDIFYEALVDVDNTATSPLADAFDSAWLKTHDESAGVSRIAMYRTTCVEVDAISSGSDVGRAITDDISLRVFAGRAVNEPLKVRDSVTGELVDLVEGLEECMVRKRQGETIAFNRRFESCNQPLAALERKREPLLGLRSGDQTFVVEQVIQRPTFHKPKMVNMFEVLGDVDFNAPGRCVEPVYDTKSYWLRATEDTAFAENEGISKIELVNGSANWKELTTVGNPTHNSNLPEEWDTDVSHLLAEWILVSRANLGAELQECGVSTISDVVTSLGLALVSTVGVRLALGIWLDKVVARPMEALTQRSDTRDLASQFRRQFNGLILREVISVVVLSSIALAPIVLSIWAERCAGRAEGKFVGVQKFEGGNPATGRLYYPQATQVEELKIWCVEPGRFESSSQPASSSSRRCRRLEGVKVVHHYVIAIGTKSSSNNAELFTWLLVGAIVLLFLVSAFESFSEPIKMWQWRMKLWKFLEWPRTIPLVLMVGIPPMDDIESSENKSLLGNGRLLGANIVSDAMICVHNRLTILLGISGKRLASGGEEEEEDKD